MTARRDHDTLIRAYLEDGPTELPGRSFDAVRDQIDHRRQRVVFGPWGFPHMNNFARLGIAAAAVLAVGVAGIKLWPGFGPPGASPSATTSVTEPPTVTAPPFEAPSLTTSPTGPAIPALPMSGDIAPGTYYRVESGPRPDVRFTFTLPAGWTVDEGSFLYRDRGLPGEVMLVTWYVSHIFADACGWEESPLMDGKPVNNEGQIVDVGTTPHELVLALTQQAGREETAGAWPWQGTLAGFAAEGVELAVPADLDTGTCTSGVLRYWPNAGPDFRYGLCCNTPGNIDFIYAININGFMFVVVARHYADSSAQALAELDAILQSMEIQ